MQHGLGLLAELELADDLVEQSRVERDADLGHRSPGEGDDVDEEVLLRAVDEVIDRRTDDCGGAEHEGRGDHHPSEPVPVGAADVVEDLADRDRAPSEVRASCSPANI